MAKNTCYLFTSYWKICEYLSHPQSPIVKYFFIMSFCREMPTILQNHSKYLFLPDHHCKTQSEMIDTIEKKAELIDLPTGCINMIIERNCILKKLHNIVYCKLKTWLHVTSAKMSWFLYFRFALFDLQLSLDNSFVDYFFNQEQLLNSSYLSNEINKLVLEWKQLLLIGADSMETLNPNTDISSKGSMTFLFFMFLVRWGTFQAQHYGLRCRNAVRLPENITFRLKVVLNDEVFLTVRFLHGIWYHWRLFILVVENNAMLFYNT